jgi:YD repeat-containing protein
MQVSDDLTGARVNLTYDDDRRLTGIQRSNGVHTALAWDNASRLTGIQDLTGFPNPSGLNLDLQYTLDAAGQVVGSAQTLPLDPAAVITASTPVNLAYDAAGRLTSSGYAYDAQGRQTAAPGHTYTWSVSSRLVGIDSVQLSYNGLGDVITRTQGATTAQFSYNLALGLQPIVAEMAAGPGSMGAEEHGSEGAEEPRTGEKDDTAPLHPSSPAPRHPCPVSSAITSGRPAASCCT